MSDTFKKGDVVRVRKDKLDGFVVAFARRIADRDAVVEGPWRFCTPGAEYYWVEFQKRNGRGRVFRERIRASEMELVRAAASIGEQT